MIFQHTWARVLSEEKTQTRRLVKSSHFLEYIHDATRITCVYTMNSGKLRALWRVGNTIAVQPGRGQKAVARIELLNIRKERLQSTTNDNAIAEGVGNVGEFSKLWNNIHKPPWSWENDPLVWVLEFKLLRSSVI